MLDTTKHKIGKALQAVGAASILAVITVGGGSALKAIADLRHDDAFEKTVFYDCVGEDLVFVYELKDGSYESTILDAAAKCGGEPEDGMWNGSRIQKLDENGHPIKE